MSNVLNLSDLFDAPLVDEHYNNIEKIEMLYSSIYKHESFFSPDADSLIKLCLRDISIYSPIKALFIKYNEPLPPEWVSFKRLAIMYECRKEYSKAIDICRQAISLGAVYDGTAGQMPGRLDRLLRLSKKYNSG